MKVSSDKPIPPELRAAILKTVGEALAGMDGDLEHGCKLEFVVEKV